MEIVLKQFIPLHEHVYYQCQIINQAYPNPHDCRTHASMNIKCSGSFFPFGGCICVVHVSGMCVMHACVWCEGCVYCMHACVWCMCVGDVCNACMCVWCIYIHLWYVAYR